MFVFWDWGGNNHENLAYAPVGQDLLGLGGWHRDAYEPCLGGCADGIEGDPFLAPEYLELRLAESIKMRHVENSITMLQELRAMVVRLSIDDFGTGYSSLSHLQRFPLNMLKIDQSFASDVTRNSANASITRAIISLAHSMNLAVLAEGVETAEQLALLRQQDCDQVQGHLFGRPMPAEEFVRWLAGAIPITRRERAA